MTEFDLPQASFEQHPLPEVDELYADGRYLPVSLMHWNGEDYREVYDALDVVTGIRVALKVAGFDLNDPESKIDEVWMQREIQAAASISHPRVLTASGYGVSCDRDGVRSYFIATRYMEHDSLKNMRHIVYDAETARSTWDKLLDGAEGLLAVEEAGFAHGDVKPENILVDRYGRAAIGDFGIVTRLQNSRNDPIFGRDLMAETEYLRCTPRFASAQQLTGASDDVLDTRSDIFSWAVAALCVLEGQHPYMRQPAKTREDAVTMYSRLVAEEFTLADRKYIPEDIYSLLRWCMAYDPAHRPQSFKEILIYARHMFDEDYEDGQLEGIAHALRDAKLSRFGRMAS